MNLRPLAAGDRERLKQFSCSDGTPHQNKVEQWCQRKPCGWVKASVHYKVWILEDDDGEIVGLYAYEPGDDGYAFIHCVAVARDHQREGLARRLLLNCLDELTKDPMYRGAYWKVDPPNEASHNLSRSVGGAEAPVPKGYKIIYGFDFPRSGIEVDYDDDEP